MQEMQEMWVQSPVWEDPLEEEMATHSSIPAWKIPRTEEPVGQQFIGSQRVEHKWATKHHHSGFKDIYTVVPSISRTSLSCKSESTHLGKNNSLYPLPAAWPWNVPVAVLNLMSVEKKLKSGFHICVWFSVIVQNLTLSQKCWLGGYETVLCPRLISEERNLLQIIPHIFCTSKN